MINKQSLLKIYTLTIADMKGRYRNTFAGVLWVMFSPILMFLVHSLVFKHILKLNVDRYFVFLLAGLLPWIFITSTIQQNASVFLTKREVLLSFQINPLSVLFSKILDNFFNFIIPFFGLFFVLLAYDDFHPVGLAFLPLNIFMLFAMTVSLNIFVATLQVFFRDMEYIVQFLFSILFFLTPIFYPEELIPDKFKMIVTFNPIYAVIKPLQKSLWKFDQELLNQALVNSFIFTISISLISYLIWRKKKNELYLYI
jgi:ABC-type polysaccharide/polyol phosphate export permease